MNIQNIQMLTLVSLIVVFFFCIGILVVQIKLYRLWKQILKEFRSYRETKQ